MRRPTLKEVAEAADVTTATVSMIINNKKKFKSSTINRVKKAMETLGYVPNVNARNLATNKTNTIAYVLGDVNNSFEIEILRGIFAKSIAAGYDILIHSLVEFHGTYSNFLKNIIVSGKVDGIITIDDIIEDDVARIIELYSFPFVMLENNQGIYSSVTVDNYKGGFLAGEYLCQKKKRKVGIVSGPIGYSWMQERIRGFKDAIVKDDIKVTNEDIFYDMSDNNWSPDLFELGKAVANEIIKTANGKYEAFFVPAGDEVAIGMIQVFMANGYKVPEDIAVIGFDDVPISRLANPPLTTISQRLQDMGGTAFDLLQKQLNPVPNESIETPSSGGAEIIVLPPELIARASV